MKIIKQSKEQGFKPIQITIEIENVHELISLWARMNAGPNANSVTQGICSSFNIDYEYKTGGNVGEGTFYFNDVQEASGAPNGENPNSGNVSSGVVNVAEWGNNWMYGVITTAAELDSLALPKR